jgi:dihydrofolate synthase/folylpolyglutamate synthase
MGIKADVSRISQLVEQLGHPERTYPTIHVAGTNGKTSTTRMIAAILAAHGLKSGVFTSPHLQSYRERFAVVGVSDEGLSGEIISKNDFAATISYLLQFTDPLEAERGEIVSQFELETALAFEWMAHLPVDVGVFETGMGGTWDATNVISPQVAVLTHIDVDHERFLGKTPIENAQEKVGIIKEGLKIVSAHQNTDVAALINEVAREKSAALLLADHDFRVTSDERAVGGRLVSIQTSEAAYTNLFLPLLGAHQARNLSLAIVAAESFLGRELNRESLGAALSVVTSPGRLEVVRREPLLVLDGAHNPEAAAALGPALVGSFGELRRVFVVAIFDDKDVEGVLRNIAAYVDEVIFTRISGERPSADPKELARLWERVVPPGKAVPVGVIDAMSEAVEYAISVSLDDAMVVVTGSLWGVGEARNHLLGPLD